MASAIGRRSRIRASSNFIFPFISVMTILIISAIMSSVGGRSINSITLVNSKNITCMDRKEDTEMSVGMIADSRSYCELMICPVITVSTSVKPLISRVDCQQILKLFPIKICSADIGLRFPHCCSECVAFRKKNRMPDKTKTNYGSMTLDQFFNIASNLVSN